MAWNTRRVFYDWPSDANDLPIQKVIQMYEGGFLGAKHDPQALERFKAKMLYPDGEAAAHQFGLAGTGAGKLVIPFVFILEMYPGGLPGAAQARGDCVSHNNKNAALLTMCGDIAAGLPDEVSGKVEGPPEVSAEGIQQGILSSESFYWFRGYDGDGWMCHDAAVVATQSAGLMVRKNYGDLGFDLTRYSGKNAGLYGARKPPQNVIDVTNKHLIRQATDVTSLEGVRDFLFNGYGISTCGGEGYQNTRDANGVSKRSGSWPHAMGCFAVDDRDSIKQIYSEPLALIMNSWAIWNSGPRDIYQSANLVPPGKKQEWIQKGIVNAATGNIMIPEGSFWAPWSHVKNREFIAFSGVNGFPRKALPDYGTSIWG